MPTARQYFEGVRAAARLVSEAYARIEALRSKEGPRPHPLEAVGHSPGPSDPMGATRERMDAEARVSQEAAGWIAEVREGREVCAGVRDANRLHRWGTALELRYCDGLQVGQVARALGVDESTARRDISCGLDYVDAHGAAACRLMRGNAR